jgi:predicted nucleic acid-binding protein
LKHGEKERVRLAADANVLLSAVLGGRARLVLSHPKVTEVLTTEHTMAEVQEYTLVLAQRKRLPTDVLLLAFAAMPVIVVDRAEYSQLLTEAKRRIGLRDPDDVEILALALKFEIPLWSNDKDFKGTGVEWVTTEQLLRRLDLI